MPLQASQAFGFIRGRRLWWLIALLTWGLYFLVKQSPANTKDQLQSIQQQWNELEAQAHQVLADEASLRALIASDSNRSNPFSGASFSVWLYNSSDSLVWWSGSATILPPGKITPGQAHVFPVPGAWWACWSKGLDTLGRAVVMAPLPLWPKEWTFSLKPKSLKIVSTEGLAVFYLQAPAQWNSLGQMCLMLICLLIACIALPLGANALGNHWMQLGRPRSSALLVCALACFTYFLYHFATSHSGLHNWPLFATQPDLPQLASSMAHWVIMALLWLWVSAFGHRHLLHFPPAKSAFNNRLLVLFIHLLSAILLWGSVAISGFLVQASRLFFSAETIFELSPLAVVVITISMTFGLGNFLVVHRLQSFAISIYPRLSFRLIAAAVVAGICALLLPAGVLHIHWTQLGLGLFLFLMGFDLFADQETPSLTWVTVWTLLIATFYAALNYNFVTTASNANPVGTGALSYLSKPFVLPDPLSFFSLHFVILVGIVSSLLGIHFYIHAIGPPFNQLRPTLRSRLQRYLLTYTLSAFVMIGWLTGSYFQDSTDHLQRTHIEEKLLLSVEALQHFSLSEKTEHLKSMAQTAQTALWLFSPSGRLYAYADGRINDAAPPPQVIPQDVRFQLDQNRLAFWLKGRADGYAAFRDRQGVLTGYLGLAINDFPATNARLFPFLENLFNLYVFLLLAAVAVAIALSGSITRPIAKIGEKLGRLQLEQNEPLQWNSQDEIGELVEKYNQMIEKLSESADRLRRSEREGAWREMAQQVAHEIKNPLTPMKLSVQHLQAAAKTRPDQAPQLLARTTQTLLEQIDNLTHIANAFSHFAKMPAPENQAFFLDELVRSVFDLFAAANETHFELSLPDHQIAVMADKSQLLRVINNLVKNAMQALPEDRQGNIQISLHEKADKAILSVADNGNGIPTKIREKVFYPNFTTKSSGMGLGLAMCKNIVESANGVIYFSTTENQGTTFFVELPVLKNNII